MLLVHVSPLRPAAPLPTAPSEGFALEARLERLLSSSAGKEEQALRALVWRLAVHPSQRVGRLHYTELSIGYIAKAAGVGRETARGAWHAVRGVLGWASLPLARVRSMGARVRALAPGGRWGQHLLLPAPCAAACDAVAARLGLGAEHSGEPTGPGWRVLAGVEPQGRHRMACCPWHDDRNPSLLLNMNSDGVSGSGVCFACVDDQGQPLRVYWRDHGGVLHARKARSVSQQGQALCASGTIHNLQAAPQPQPGQPALPALPGRYLLATLTSDGMRRRASASPDLLAVLKYADRRSQGDRAWGTAAAAMHTGEGPGQQYVSADPMRPVEWTTIATKRGQVHIPTRWEPTAVQWVLADLDGFTGAPIDNSGLALGGEALERWAQGQPLLSGRVAVVRTSHLGVQVVVELAEARGAPRQWYATGEARALDAAALSVARAVGFSGGHADPAVHAAGRLMRRPGWRTCKDGMLTRSGLAYCSPGSPT